ncbi:MAG: hypothetical protein ACK5PG_13340 [Lysobacterales bacterium]|jgi:hypothetical protein
MRALTFYACLALVCPGKALADPLADAEALFERFQALGQAYDPTVADLYCDSALIRNIRTYPTGQQRVMEFPGHSFKDMIRTVMPLAKARGDVSTYSEIQTEAEGANVRISAIRFSVLKNYSSPVSILVGQCPDGSLGVLEELSESRP